MKFFFECLISSSNPGPIIKGEKSIEAQTYSDALIQAQDLESKYLLDYGNEEDVVIKMTLCEPGKKPFWFCDRGKFKHIQSDTS